MKNQKGHWGYCWCPWVEWTVQCEDNNNEACPGRDMPFIFLRPLTWRTLYLTQKMFFEKNNGRTGWKIPWLKYTTKHVATRDWDSDDLGWRGSVMRKTFSPKNATSIAARLQQQQLQWQPQQCIFSTYLCIMLRDSRACMSPESCSKVLSTAGKRRHVPLRQSQPFQPRHAFLVVFHSTSFSMASSQTFSSTHLFQLGRYYHG